MDRNGKPENSQPAGRRQTGSRWEQEAELSQERYWEWALAGRRLAASPRYYALRVSRLGGIGLGRASGPDLIEPADLQAVRDRLQALLDGPPGQDRFEWRHRATRSTGRDAEWVRVRGQVSRRDAAGRPQRLIGSLCDISAQMRAEQAQQEGEARYRELVEQADSIVLRFDARGTLIYLNPFAERFFGFSAEELVGRPILGTIVPDTETTGRDLRRMVEQLCADPERFAINEHENITRDGRRVWVRWNNRVVRDRDGKPAGVLSAGMDISERKRMEARLAENEARYQAYLIASPAVILLVRDGRVLFANPFALDLLGFDTPRQIDGSPVEEMIAASDLEVFRERVRRCEPGEGGTPVEIHVLRRDGSQRVLATVAVSVRLEDGPALLLMGQDISERKRAEERARLEVERLQSLVEIGQHRADSVQELLDYTLEQALALTRSRYGYILHYSEERGEFTLNSWSRGVMTACSVQDPQVTCQLERAGIWGEVVRQRRPVLSNDFAAPNPLKRGYPAGHVALKRFLSVPVISGGRIVAVVGVANKEEPYEDTDILQLSLLMDSVWKMVERRQAEEALLESRRDLARAQAVAHIGSWKMSLPQEEMHWSEETYRIFALPAGTPMTYASFLQTVHPEDRAIVGSWRQAVLRGEPEGLEHRILAEGAVKWVHGRAQVELDVEGRPTGGFGTVQDITERKKLEAQFLQAQKMEAVGRLTGGIAHDFNNLLTVIAGNSELAMERLGSGAAPAEEMGEIQRAVKRAAELIRKLLAFSRRQVAAPKLIDLNAVLAEMERMLRRLIGEHIELVTRMAEGLPAVRIDPGQVEQVITNLAVNARDAMSEGGRLTLETAAVSLDESSRGVHPEVTPGPYVQLSVSDTGTGMSAEVQSHLFEPFYTTKPVGKGSGLGLSTCYGIVKQNGGFIWIYSEERRGTTVKVYLPAEEEAAESREMECETAPAAAGGSETILLVEDEAGIRRTTERILSGCGYRVLAAAEGSEALEIVGRLERPPALLLTDVVMPGLGGRELAERLTARCPALKVLYISGYTDDVIAHHGILEEGIELLSKPFSAASLAARVREVLDR